MKSNIRKQVGITLLAALIAVPAAGQGVDELFAFPPQVEIAVGATSFQPIIAIERYDDGAVVDMTRSLTVSIDDPGIAQSLPVDFEEGGDTQSYVYIRGVAVGSTTATVSAGGLTVALPVTVVASQEPGAALTDIPMAVGTNLTDFANLSSELVMSDVFMSSQPWVSSSVAGGWGNFPDPLDLDDRGWVRSLLPGQAADTMMLFDLDGHYPKGSYTLTWQGSGTIVVEKGFTEVPYPRIDHPDLGSMKVAEIVVGDDDGIRLRLTAIGASPIRDLRLWMPEEESGIHPGNADSPPADPFREDFLRQISRYGLVRFGLWQLAMDGTDNLAVSWSDATPVDYATQFHPWGTSPEWIVRLINVLNRRSGEGCIETPAEPWINIPYMADDSYVRGIAELFATQIDFAANPAIRIHVEWANEVWNPAFLHFGYAADLGLALDLDHGTGDDLIAAIAYQVYRSLQIFAIFEDVFTRTHPVPGGMDRLRRVLAGAAGFPYANTVLLNEPGAVDGIDAFAIAPYFGGQVGIDVNQMPAGTLPTVDGLLDLLDNPADPDNLSQSDLEQRLREIANTAALLEVWRRQSGRSIDLIAYESGQHLVGAGYDTAPHVLPLFEAANAHERMGDMYRRLFLAWNRLGGSEINHFVHREKWWSTGLFGALAWYDEDETTPGRPKYQALLEALAGAALLCDDFESGDTAAWLAMAR